MQLTLDHNPPFQSHSQTSAMASDAIRTKAPTKRALVLAFLQFCWPHGATDDEMQRGLAMNPSTQRPRRIELCDARLVVDSARKRLTASGNPAVVWVVNEAENLQ